ncbi:Zinc finger protein 800 [Plakobranchus ocellatus]|uniref:Zinc finger protein 800 n=1 Tax=Plakobranchus ocellatus TaxID=259542 RepID=A0AAV4D034_9GAST|nr:Zinc finger protein 800 [Plakobranchus ocellatus]
MKPISRRMKQINREKDGKKIDVSQLRQPIQLGGSALEQILNGIHYGTTEMRSLLQQECNFIFECKVCRALFRDLPNFISHKRNFCDKSALDENWMDLANMPADEVIVVEPEPPEESRPDTCVPSSSLSANEQDYVHRATADNHNQPMCGASKNFDSLSELQHETTSPESPEKQATADYQSDIVSVKQQQQKPDQKHMETSATSEPRLSLEKTIQRIQARNQRKSSALVVYTEAADKLQRQKENVRVTTIKATPIPTNRNAVFVDVSTSSKNEQDHSSYKQSSQASVLDEDFHEKRAFENQVTEKEDEFVQHRKTESLCSNEEKKAKWTEKTDNEVDRKFSNTKDELGTQKNSQKQNMFKKKEIILPKKEQIFSNNGQEEHQQRLSLDNCRSHKKKGGMRLLENKIGEEKKHLEKKDEEKRRSHLELRENISSPAVRERNASIGKEPVKLSKTKDIYPEPQQILMDNLREMQDKVKQKAAAEGKMEILEVSDEDSDPTTENENIFKSLSPLTNNDLAVASPMYQSKSPSLKHGVYKCRMCTYEAVDKADCTRHILRKHRYAMRHKSASAIRSMAVFQSSSKRHKRINSAISQDSSEKSNQELQQEKSDLRDMVRKNLQFALQKAEEVLSTRQHTKPEPRNRSKKEQKKEDDTHPLKCQKCGKLYSSKSSLKFHDSVVHAEQRTYYPCSICKNVFSSLFNAMRHMKTAHGKSSEKVEEMRSILKKKAFSKSVSLPHEQNGTSNISHVKQELSTRKRALKNSVESTPLKRIKQGDEDEMGEGNQFGLSSRDVETPSKRNQLNNTGNDLSHCKGKTVASRDKANDYATRIIKDEKNNTIENLPALRESHLVDQALKSDSVNSLIHLQKARQDTDPESTQSPQSILPYDVSARNNPYICSKCKRSFGRKISFDNHVEGCCGVKMDTVTPKSEAKVTHMTKSLTVDTVSDRMPVLSPLQRSSARKLQRDTPSKSQLSPVSLLSVAGTIGTRSKHRDSSSESQKSTSSELLTTGPPKARRNRSLSADRSKGRVKDMITSKRCNSIKRQTASFGNIHDGIRGRARRSVYSKYSKALVNTQDLSKTQQSQQSGKSDGRKAYAIKNSDATLNSVSDNSAKKGASLYVDSVELSSSTPKDESKEISRSKPYGFNSSIQTRNSKPALASKTPQNSRRSSSQSCKESIDNISVQKSPDQDRSVLEAGKDGCNKRSVQPEVKGNVSETLNSESEGSEKFCSVTKRSPDNMSYRLSKDDQNVPLQSVISNFNAKLETQSMPTDLKSPNLQNIAKKDDPTCTHVVNSIKESSPNRSHAQISENDDACHSNNSIVIHQEKNSLPTHVNVSSRLNTGTHQKSGSCQKGISEPGEAVLTSRKDHLQNPQRNLANQGAIDKLMDALRQNFVKKTNRGRQLDDTGLELSELKTETAVNFKKKDSTEAAKQETENNDESAKAYLPPSAPESCNLNHTSTKVSHLAAKEEKNALKIKKNVLIVDYSNSTSTVDEDIQEESASQSPKKMDDHTLVNSIHPMIEDKMSLPMSWTLKPLPEKIWTPEIISQGQVLNSLSISSSIVLESSKSAQHKSPSASIASQNVGEKNKHAVNSPSLSMSSAEQRTSKRISNSAPLLSIKESGKKQEKCLNIKEINAHAVKPSQPSSRKADGHGQSSKVEGQGHHMNHNSSSDEKCDLLPSVSTEHAENANDDHGDLIEINSIQPRHLRQSSSSNAPESPSASGTDTHSESSERPKRDHRQKISKISERIKEKTKLSSFRSSTKQSLSKSSVFREKSTRPLKRREGHKEMKESTKEKNVKIDSFDTVVPKNTKPREVLIYKDEGTSDDLKATRIKSTANRTYVMRTTAGAEKLECFDKSKIYKFVDKAKTSCLACGEKYTKMYNLRRHIIRNHLKWTRFKCILCGCETYDRSECARHIKKAHRKTLRPNQSVKTLIVNLTKQGCQARSQKISHSIKKNQETERKQSESIYARPTLSLRRRGRPTLALLSSPPASFENNSQKASISSNNNKQNVGVKQGKDATDDNAELNKSAAHSSALTPKFTEENLSLSCKNTTSKSITSETEENTLDAIDPSKWKESTTRKPVVSSSDAMGLSQVSKFRCQASKDCPDKKNIFAQIQSKDASQAISKSTESTKVQPQESVSRSKRSEKLAESPSYSHSQEAKTVSFTAQEIASPSLQKSHSENSIIGPSSSCHGEISLVVPSSQTVPVELDHPVPLQKTGTSSEFNNTPPTAKVLQMCVEQKDNSSTTSIPSSNVSETVAVSSQSFSTVMISQSHEGDNSFLAPE